MVRALPVSVLLVLIVVLVGCGPRDQPTVTYHLFASGTSSAASRSSSAFATFTGDRLVSANRSHGEDGALGLHVSCVEQYDTRSRTWHQVGAGTDARFCLDEEFFLTRQKIENRIRDGSLQPRSAGCRFQWCYEIINGK